MSPDRPTGPASEDSAREEAAAGSKGGGAGGAAPKGGRKQGSTPAPGGLRAIALALAIGALGGWLAKSLSVPLPWMIGAMVATMTAAVAGLRIRVPGKLRNLFVVVLGLMLGSAFQPEVLDHLGEWVVSLAALALYCAGAGGLGVLYFRKVCKYEPVTAYFSAMPGGLAEMVLTGTAMGGDARLISLTHGARVMLVVLCLPFAFQLFAGYEPGDRPPTGVPFAEEPILDLLVLAASGAAGYFGARALRLPAGAVLGPMVLSAGLHLAGLTTAKAPTELVAAAQVVMGSAVGARFAGTKVMEIARALFVALGGTAILLVAAVIFAVALSAITGLPVPELVLAFSPGGVAEMSLVAVAIGAEAPFVATHHLVRITYVVIGAPLAFRLWRRRSPPPARPPGT